jgi:hypothetical protein
MSSHWIALDITCDIASNVIGKWIRLDFDNKSLDVINEDSHSGT